MRNCHPCVFSFRFLRRWEKAMSATLSHQLLKPFELSCTVLILYPLPRRFFSFRYRCICGPRHLRYSLPPSRRVCYNYRRYSCIFRPTNNIRLYLLATAIPKYLKVRCYGQAYVISALAYRFRFRNSLSRLLICRDVRDLWEFYLPLVSARQEERIYVSTCVYVAGDLECTFLAQSTIGCAKIAGENCGRECGGEREGETSRKLCKNAGDENPFRESRSIPSRWTVRSRVSLANKNKANTYFRCCPGAPYLHSRNPGCTCIR